MRRAHRAQGTCETRYRGTTTHMDEAREAKKGVSHEARETSEDVGNAVRRAKEHAGHII